MEAPGIYYEIRRVGSQYYIYKLVIKKRWIFRKREYALRDRDEPYDPFDNSWWDYDKSWHDPITFNNYEQAFKKYEEILVKEEAIKNIPKKEVVQRIYLPVMDQLEYYDPDETV